VELDQPRTPGVSREPTRMDLIMVATAMPAVNAIPAVCQAPPGIVSYADLPLIGAAGSLLR
jgi:4-hydroxy-tetrahydrodipicolinate reductase